MNKSIKDMSGIEKCAVILLSLSKPVAAKFLSTFSPSEVEGVTKAMAGLKRVSPELNVEVQKEFMQRMSGGGALYGDPSTTRELLLQAGYSKEEVDEMMKAVQVPLQGEEVWEVVNNQDPASVANYLVDENPQTIALVLQKMRPDCAAAVLQKLPRNHQFDISARMVTMEPVAREMQHELEHALQQEFVHAASRSSGEDQYQSMANMFNKMDPEVFKTISGHLEVKHPDLFDRIKKKMFVFDDLRRLDTQSLGKVIRAGEKVPLCLKGVDVDLRDAFLNALSSRQRDMLIEDIQNLGSVRASEVNEAQSALVDVAKRLADEGVIVLPSNNEEDGFIE